MAALRSSLKVAALSSSLRHYRLLSTTTTTTTTSPLSTLANKVVDTDTSSIASNIAQDLAFTRLAKSQKFAEVEKLVDSQKKDPRITQEDYFSTVIRSCGYAGMSDYARTLYDQMEELGTPRSSISFNALLSAYNMSRKFDQVSKVFEEMPQKYGFSPDKISYGFLIKSLCESGSPEFAIPVLEQMEKKNIETVTINYTKILDALYKKGKVNEAERLWNEMVEKGCSPDVWAYNTRLMNAQQGKPEDVLALIEEMKTKGIEPDITSYNYLFACYCKNGMMESAQKVSQDLEKNGCVPNSATFRLRITHLCYKGDYEMAYEVFEESMRRNRVPAFRILKLLVKGLAKISKRKEAKGVIKAVREKLPDDFFDAWNKLELELGLNEDEASAVASPGNC